jgi:3-deoxy-D-manno-octulosonic-acid transferase
VAFIGGGFSGQLHNIIEPAAAGCFTLYGPNAKKFPESELFEELNIGNKINNPIELSQKIEMYLRGHNSVNKDFIKNQVHKQVSNIQNCVEVIISVNDLI